MLRTKVPGAVIALSAVLGSVALLAGFLWTGLAVWVLGYGLLLVRQIREIRYRRWRNHAVTQVATRISFTFGIAGPLIYGDANGALFAWLALSVTVFLIRFSRGILEISRSLPFDVINLPGADLPQPHPRTLTALMLTLLALPALLMAFAVAQLHGVALAVCAAAVAIIALVALIQALRRRRAGDRLFAELQSRLESYDPTFILYWVAPVNSAYQIKMWLPFLERLGERFIVVVRNAGSLPEAIAAVPNHPIVFARTLSSIDNILPATVSTVFYVNNADRNAHMVRYNHLTHIQLLHGDSEKASSYNPVTAMYDRIYVAGQAGIDRYADNNVRIPEDKFAIVGRPQVEDVIRDDSPIGEKDRPTVLYAPTWRGYFNDSTYSSLLMIEPLLDRLIERGSRIVFRPHPYSRQDGALSAAIDRIHDRLRADNESSDTGHLFGFAAETEMTVNDCFNISDAMLADVSSVVSDYLYSGKPLGLMTGASSPEELIRELPLARSAYIFPGTDETVWDEQLAAMLGNDPLADMRREMRRHYLGDLPADGYADIFVRTAKEDLARAEERHRAQGFTFAAGQD